MVPVAVRRKPAAGEAIQYTGENWEEVEAWVEAHDGTCYSSTRNDNHWVIEYEKEDPWPLSAGDWIVGEFVYDNNWLLEVWTEVGFGVYWEIVE